MSEKRWTVDCPFCDGIGWGWFPLTEQRPGGPNWKDEPCPYCNNGTVAVVPAQAHDELREARVDGPYVWIQRERFAGVEQLVCGDEGGEFARADALNSLVPYLLDLIYGHGTLREGPLPIVRDEPGEPMTSEPESPDR